MPALKSWDPPFPTLFHSLQLKCVFPPGTYAWGAVYQFRVWQKPSSAGAEALALELPLFTAPKGPVPR